MAFKRNAPIPIVEGGTNAVSMANTDGIVYFDGTSLVTTAVGTATNVLTSNGAGMAPTFQAAGGGGGVSLTGDTGGALGPSASFTFDAVTQAGNSASFSGSGTTMSLNLTDSQNNTFLGKNSGRLGSFGINQISIGGGSLANTNGNNNIAIGQNSLNLSSSDFNNIAIGVGTLEELNGGSRNLSMGFSSLSGLLTGSNNTSLGFESGQNYVGSESFNIILGGLNGVASEQGVTRIGNADSNSGTPQIACYIEGISGATITNAGKLVAVDNTNGQVANTGFNYWDTNGDNVIIGQNAGNSSITGDRNVALGRAALTTLSSANDNTCIGDLSGGDTSTGSGNTAIGSSALGLAGAPVNNIAIGLNAASAYTTTETGNICIGPNGVIGESNITRIGYINGTASTQTSCFVDGISGVTVTGTAVLVAANGQLGIAVSSERYKDNITDMADNAVMGLRPVNFTYKSDKSNRTQYGLIAEEVEQAFPDLVFYGEDGLPQSVHYEQLPVLLLKELQKQNKRIEALEAQLSRR